MVNHLHAHSENSNLRLIDSIIKVSDLVQSAFNMGCSSIALTDHECLSGHIKALQKGKKIRDKNPDFKVLLGNEIYLTETRDKNQKYYHFLLIAKDEIGYKQIRELSSKAWMNSYYDRRLERVPTLKSEMEEVVSKNKGHLIASTACLGSEFSQLVLELIDTKQDEVKDRIHEFVSWCLDLFGEDFYIEIQPSSDLTQIAYNKVAIRIAKAYNIKFVVTCDVHYIKASDRKVHSAYLNSKDEERETADFYSATYMKAEEEIRKDLDYLDTEDIAHAIQNTISIPDKCEQIDLERPVVVPELHLEKTNISHLFKDWYMECPHIEKFANSEHIQDRYFLELVEKGFIKKNQELNTENVHRINLEIEEIWEISERMQQRVSAYYTLTERVVDIMWDDRLGNSLVGVARGSVTGFYTCYLMGITQLNPIKYDLPHWRHLHKSRPEMPDIDVDSEASKRPQIFRSLKEVFGYDNVLNIATFKTEGSKSAFLTSCRGLGIDIDSAQEIADMIPSERGKLWSLIECFEGNEELDRKPIKELIKRVEEYPLLKETALKIEGLICGRSVHASGVYIFKDGYLEQSAFMRAPKGQPITCWNMEDNDTVGALKMDCLTIQALDKIRQTMNLLSEYGRIEWKETLRDTYDAYLHPDRLEYDSSEMWDILKNRQVLDLFQYETMVGQQTIDKIHPSNIMEMSIGNSLMRLMSDGTESPLDKYARFKLDITQWYTEMKEHSLTPEEIEVMKGQLLINYGIAGEQENLMTLSMDKGISNFDVAEANLLRKAVAKKKADVLGKAKKLFFEKGLKNGTREELLNYVWDFCVMPQSGYGFSKNHSVPYSVIGLQELNLVYIYGQIFWNCACLTVNSGYLDEEEEYSEEEEVTATEETSGEDSEETEVKEKTKSKSKTVKYGKIAKAICDIQHRDVKMFLPDINKAKMEFSPDLEREGIIFGMKSISGVGEDLVKQIIEKRPFSSIFDFLERVDITAVQILNLVKSGSFDEIESKDRKKWCIKSLFYLLSKSMPPKTKLSMQNFAKMIEMDFLPEEKQIYGRYYNYRKYISLPEFKSQDGYVKLDEKAQQFYNNEFKNPELIVNSSDGIYLNFKGFEKLYKKKMEELKDWLSEKETLDKFNEAVYNKEIEEMMDKYCEGTIQQWEMSALNFYYSGHELAGIDKEHYGLVDFSSLPEEPLYTVTSNKNSKEFKKYNLDKICGTVIDVNKTRHIVYLLTEDGVVNLKLYAGAFVHYNKQISSTNSEGKKTVLEKSWFKRGAKLMVVGFRRGDYFFPRKYFNSVYQHTITRITNFNENTGRVDLQFERIRT